MAKTMYKVASKVVTTRKKNGGEDPPKRSALAAPSSDMKLKTPTKESVKEEAIKSTSAKFKKNKNYNYLDTKIRANKTDTPKATAKIEKKDSEKRFTNMYQSGEISRGAYRDSLMTLQAPGTSKKEVRQIARANVGGGIKNVARDAGRTIKKGAKNVAVNVKKVGKAIGKACTPSGGSCNPKRNKTMGGTF